MFLDDDTPRKRTLGIRDKQILYRNAKGRCQNPGCGKKIDFDEMEVGHKTAWSRGGNTTFKNSVCLCHRCNKLQGTDSWTTFLRKQGIEAPEAKIKQSKAEVKQSLEAMSVEQLKSLAKKHGVEVKGRIVDDFLDSHRVAPTKSEYVKKLSPVVTSAELSTVGKASAQPEGKKKSRTT